MSWVCITFASLMAWMVTLYILFIPSRVHTPFDAHTYSHPWHWHRTWFEITFIYFFTPVMTLLYSQFNYFITKFAPWQSFSAFLSYGTSCLCTATDIFHFKWIFNQSWALSLTLEHELGIGDNIYEWIFISMLLLSWIYQMSHTFSTLNSN